MKVLSSQVTDILSGARQPFVPGPPLCWGPMAHINLLLSLSLPPSTREIQKGKACGYIRRVRPKGILIGNIIVTKSTVQVKGSNVSDTNWNGGRKDGATCQHLSEYIDAKSGGVEILTKNV